MIDQVLPLDGSGRETDDVWRILAQDVQKRLTTQTGACWWTPLTVDVRQLLLASLDTPGLKAMGEQIELLFAEDPRAEYRITLVYEGRTLWVLCMISPVSGGQFTAAINAVSGALEVRRL